MGGCFSKKRDASSSSSVAVANRSYPNATTGKTQRIEAVQTEIKPRTVRTEDEEENLKREGCEERRGVVKKEVFVIKHRKSHDRPKSTDLTGISVSTEEKPAENSNPNTSLHSNAVVRTSSCTKEELDAILIQCGRLSRSNSSAAKTRRYSGSKRSFDFDQNEKSSDGDAPNVADLLEEGEDDRRLNRQRYRRSASPRDRRRRTPSRERDQPKQGRSGSRERANTDGTSSRRVSRSPGRRSETSGGSSSSNTNSGKPRPGKMVSVPATDKTLLVTDKSSNNNNNVESSIKRITVKRNVGEGPRTAASPRSQSPARANTQQPAPFSKNSSSKTEQSPSRRRPLEEIDTNSLPYVQSNANNSMGFADAIIKDKKVISTECQAQGAIKRSADFVFQKTNYEMNNCRMTNQAANSRAASPNGMAREHQELAKDCRVAPTGTEFMKPQAVARSRSLRRSRDFDINPEILSNNLEPSYTAMLLEDIQNFHQKSVNIQNPVSLPPCISKACSILEAVADLNSTTKTNSVSDHKFSFCAKKSVVKDDLMIPDFEKYVTVKRGGSLEDMEEQESCDSNSFTGSSGLSHQWGISSSPWEPNSSDSTDRWSSGSNNSKQRDHIAQKIEFDPLKNGIGRGRVGVSKNLQAITRVGVEEPASM